MVVKKSVTTKQRFFVNLMSHFINQTQTTVNLNNANIVNNFVDNLLQNDSSYCNVSDKSTFGSGVDNLAVDEVQEIEYKKRLNTFQGKLSQMNEYIHPSIQSVNTYYNPSIEREYSVGRHARLVDLDNSKTENKVWAVINDRRHMDARKGVIKLRDKDIAELVGCSIDHVGRILRKFAKQGKLQLGAQKSTNGRWLKRSITVALVRGFDKSSVRHFCRTNKAKALEEERKSNNNNCESTFSKIEEEKAVDVTQEFIKEFSNKSFWPGKAGCQFMDKKGISYFGKEWWVKEFREVLRRQKPWNGDPEWNFQNANYAFFRFINEEVRLKNKLGEKRYISRYKRTEFKMNKFQREKTLENQENIIKELKLKYDDIELTELMHALYNRIGHFEFKMWVLHLELEKKEKGVWYFTCPTRFIAEWNRNNHIPLMKKINPAIKRVEIRPYDASIDNEAQIEKERQRAIWIAENSERYDY